MSAHGGWELNISPGFYSYAKLNMKLRGRLHAVHPNNFLLFNSLEEHIEVYPLDRTTRSLALVFPEKILVSILEETGVNPREVVFSGVSHDLNENLMGTVRTIFSLRDGESTSRLAFDCLAMDLLLKILEACPSSASSSLSKKYCFGNFPSNIARAKKIIAENIGNSDFCLADLSDQAGISKFHLIRCFKNHTGVSPNRYLSIVRLEYAKSLLAKGLPVSDVALLSGFGTFSAFNKAFKKRNHIPPVLFRRHGDAVERN